MLRYISSGHLPLRSPWFQKAQSMPSNEFRGSGQPLTDEGVASACSSLGADGPEVWAVVIVETRGFGFLRDRRPEILFERHVFHRLTHGRFGESHPELSAVMPGGYIGNAAEYNRLEAAIDLDRDAALQSTSWGIGQVMGFNFAKAGFASIDAMIGAMVVSEDAQLHAMASFTRTVGLAGALQRHDWKSFAAGYNGKAFRAHEYDHRLAVAYAHCCSEAPDLKTRTVQAALFFLGYAPGRVDGLMGPLTRGALSSFQRRNKLPVTGLLDGETRLKVLDQAFPMM